VRGAAALVLSVSLAGPLQAAGTVEVSKPLPAGAIQVQTLQGDPLDLATLLRSGTSHRAVLLVFWGTWCAPCLREIPELKELRRFHGPRGLEVLGVAVQHGEETLDVLLRAVRDHGINYPVYFDARGEAARMFGVTALPAAALIDAEGVVRWMGPSLPKDINERIQAALGPGEDRAGR
jgi:thiol-disulfide isomerase/thioredoxin